MAEAAQGRWTSTRLGGTRPPNVCVMQPPHVSSRMRPRGEGPPSIRSGGMRWWALSRMPPPPTPKGKAPTPSPKLSKVAQVAAQAPPPPKPLMWGPWRPMWPPT